MKNTDTPETEALAGRIDPDTLEHDAYATMTMHAIKLERERNATRKQLHNLVTACNEYEAGASISHPRYTRQLSAARKFLENSRDQEPN